MSVLLPVAPSLSVAWTQALSAVLDQGGLAVNVVASWRNGTDESPEIRGAIDEFLTARRAEQSQSTKQSWPIWSVETVANTICPIDLYFPALGDAAVQRFKDLYMEGRDFARSVAPQGEYCERLVAYPGPTGEVNQLEVVATKLRRIRAKGNGAHGALSSDYELAIDLVDDSDSLRIQAPGLNNSRLGFPCLSHISLTIHQGELHLTATYRNQHLVRKGYGNYLGLARLASLLAQEAGLPVGEIMVIATHADAEVGSTAGFGVVALRKLVSVAVK